MHRPRARRRRCGVAVGRGLAPGEEAEAGRHLTCGGPIQRSACAISPSALRHHRVVAGVGQAGPVVVHLFGRAAVAAWPPSPTPIGSRRRGRRGAAASPVRPASTTAGAPSAAGRRSSSTAFAVSIANRTRSPGCTASGWHARLVRRPKLPTLRLRGTRGQDHRLRRGAVRRASRAAFGRSHGGGPAWRGGAVAPAWSSSACGRSTGLDHPTHRRRRSREAVLARFAPMSLLVLAAVVGNDHPASPSSPCTGRVSDITWEGRPVAQRFVDHHARLHGAEPRRCGDVVRRGVHRPRSARDC